MNNDSSNNALPMEHISLQTLIYVGVSAEKVADVWERWTHFNDMGGPFIREGDSDTDIDSEQMPFIEFVIGHTVKSGLVGDASGDKDAEWRDGMNVCGISVETQDAIMDPHFAYLRRSNSCVYWARETINIRYAVLVNISYTREHGKEQQYVPVAPSGDWSSQHIMAAYSTPGFVVLYKTVIQPRYCPLYDETGALADIRALYSPPPSDFSGVKMLICLTPDVEVVEYQASYIRRRAEHTPAGIVCLCIPTNAFKTLAGDGEESCVQHLSWPSNEWKELVWYSRTDRTLPPRLSRYGDAALIAEPMAWGPRLAFAALKCWEDITDKFLFKVGGDGGGEGRVAVYEVCFRRVWHEGLAGEQGPGNEGVLLCGSRDGLVAGREPFRGLGLNGVNWERQNRWTGSLSCKRNEGPC